MNENSIYGGKGVNGLTSSINGILLGFQPDVTYRQFDIIAAVRGAGSVLLIVVRVGGREYVVDLV